MMNVQELRQLRNILNSALDELEDIASRDSPEGTWPALDKPIGSASEWEEPHKDPVVKKLSNVIVAASYQLINVVREPFLSLIDIASGSLVTAALNTANELNVAEILHESGPNGLHVSDIGAKCKAHPEKLGRALRVLATHHIFREVEPNVFAHNRISSLLDTGIPHHKLLEDQLNKFTTYTKNGDISGYVGHFVDDVTRASLYHLDDVREKEGTHNNRTAFQKAYDTDNILFAWLHDPANKYVFTRHSACIRATLRWDAPEATLKGFDWGSLAPGSLVVDVGGGTGRPALVLAKGFPHLKIQVQDRQAVVQNGLEYWKENYNEALTEGRVSFLAHDFFQPQPVQGAQVYFARVVFHDWDDGHVIQILKNLRAAASPDSRLVVADYVTPFASQASIPQANLVKGDATHVTPAPLLPNLGKAGANTYMLDMAMQLLLDGKERTLLQHSQVLEDAGWNIVEVRLATNSHFGFITAKPV